MINILVVELEASKKYPFKKRLWSNLLKESSLFFVLYVRKLLLQSQHLHRDKTSLEQRSAKIQNDVFGKVYRSLFWLFKLLFTFFSCANVSVGFYRFHKTFILSLMRTVLASSSSSELFKTLVLHWMRKAIPQTKLERYLSALLMLMSCYTLLIRPPFSSTHLRTVIKRT